MDTLERLRKAVPFEHVCLGGLDLDGYRFGSGRSIDTDMPIAFLDHYYGEGLSQIDPLVSYGQKAKVAFSEEEATDVMGAAPKVEALKSSHEIGKRFFIPLARNGKVFGGVCFTTQKRFTADEMAFLTFSAEPLYWQLIGPLMRRFAPAELGLTAGELTCLTLASHGLTSEEIAASSAYKTETVNSYLKAATKKLGVANRAEAIADAIRRRLID